uniref:CTP synthase n=1 Tax=uncultured Bacteroidota bacterium TaxID=152509 RepID=H5SNV9_9BACT|nr:CTP synthase [uncultured Bacteroidetes bacterium]
MRYIFVTGGVVSSLGKGIVAASLGKLLQARGYRVTLQKFDPYLNVDPGTLNPYEHGEVFVTHDGAETDLDLGHYERFLGIQTTRDHNVTTGKIYQTILERERRGEYLGKTVQVIPHVTDEIKRRFTLLAQKDPYDIVITELGGTVGDIESLPYIEAARQLHYELGPLRVLFVHLTLIVYLEATQELKTKPTQHSVKELQQAGIQPDVLVCRTARPLSRELRAKIALHTNVPRNAVIQALDVPMIYQVPFQLMKEKLDEVVLRRFRLPVRGEPAMSQWRTFVEKLQHAESTVRIGLVGKYVELHDAYKSIEEALIHAAGWQGYRVEVVWIHSADLTPENVERRLRGLQGILVAPGFGERGIAGKILAIRYAREQKVPFLGICLGMQMAVVEFARHVLEWREAHSTEIQPDTPYPVIDLMPDQRGITDKGGTMRLGAYPCEIRKGTLAWRIYQKSLIYERHRHRYELNNRYRAALEEAGLIVSGRYPAKDLVEIVELRDHPFFIGVQFHPEFQSRVEQPHPLFMGFVEAAARS